MQLQPQQTQGIMMNEVSAYAVQLQSPQQHSIVMADTTAYAVNMPMNMVPVSSPDLTALETNTEEDTNALANMEEPQQVCIIQF